MSLNVKLIDAKGSGKSVKVSEEGSLSVTVHQHPPEEEHISTIPYRALFSTTAGVTDMRVNGATTNVEFSIRADSSKDTYIKTISFVIADASAVLNKFGNITALTNGCTLQWVTKDKGTVTISNGFKSNFELVRLCCGNPAFGATTNSFLASDVAGASEGYIPVMDIQQIFGLQYGLRLRAGTDDKITITIRDNTTGVDQFDAIAYGIQI